MLSKTFVTGLLLAFLANTIGPVAPIRAQEFHLPAPGVRVALSPSFQPPLLTGLKVHPDNPFKFEFILDQGDSKNMSSPNALIGDPQQEQLKQQSTTLIKYFLASLTTSEQDLWVNLSPYEKDRIVPLSFGKTEMGRDLLAQDYILKQVTASLLYPEGEVGQKFWARIYAQASRRFGTTNIPVNTFNKVWILPDKAVIYENPKAGTVYVVEAKLKVMLEEDYLSTQIHRSQPGDMFLLEQQRTCPHARCQANPALNLKATQVNSGNAVPSVKTILKEIVIPELTRDVNQGQNFAQLRQVYNSLILAEWYKRKIKDGILAQVYANKKKIAGMSSPNALIGDPQHIYQQYLKAFKQGSYNYIKEETDPISHQSVPRKYFSGGTFLGDMAMTTTPVRPTDNASSLVLDVRFDPVVTRLTQRTIHDLAMTDTSHKFENMLRQSTDQELLSSGSLKDFHARPLSMQEVQALMTDESVGRYFVHLKAAAGWSKMEPMVNKIMKDIARGRPSFDVQELSYRSPFKHEDDDPIFSHTEKVYARYFMPKGMKAKKLPALVIPSFYDADPYARFLSVYLASQGVVVLVVALPLYSQRSVPGTEGLGTVARFVKLDFDAPKFQKFIVQSVADVIMSSHWLVSRPQVDGAKVSVAGQSNTAAIASSAYLLDPTINNLYAMVPVVNYAHLYWNSSPRNTLWHHLMDQKSITENDFEKQMRGFHLGDLAKELNSRKDHIYLGIVQNDELVPYRDAKLLEEALGAKQVFESFSDKPENAHLLGSISIGVSKGFFQNMLDSLKMEPRRRLRQEFKDYERRFMKFWAVTDSSKYANLRPVEDVYWNRILHVDMSKNAPKILPERFAGDNVLIDIREAYAARHLVENDRLVMGSTEHKSCVSYVILGLDSAGRRVLSQAHFFTMDILKDVHRLIRIIKDKTSDLHDMQIALIIEGEKGRIPVSLLQSELAPRAKTVSILLWKNVIAHFYSTSVFSSPRGIAIRILTEGGDELIMGERLPSENFFVFSWEDLKTQVKIINPAMTTMTRRTMMARTGGLLAGAILPVPVHFLPPIPAVNEPGRLVLVSDRYDPRYPNLVSLHGGLNPRLENFRPVVNAGMRHKYNVFIFVYNYHNDFDSLVEDFVRQIRQMKLEHMFVLAFSLGTTIFRAAVLSPQAWKKGRNIFQGAFLMQAAPVAGGVSHTDPVPIPALDPYKEIQSRLYSEDADQAFDHIIDAKHKVNILPQNDTTSVENFPDSVAKERYQRDISRGYTIHIPRTGHGDLLENENTIGFIEDLLSHKIILNHAMIAHSSSVQDRNVLGKGGIDLTSSKAISIQNIGQNIQFHIDPAQLAQWRNADGIVPVVVDIRPLKSLSAFLGN